jgi:hypothetical protein
MLTDWNYQCHSFTAFKLCVIKAFNNVIFVDDPSVFTNECPCLIKVVIQEGRNCFGIG